MQHGVTSMSYCRACNSRIIFVQTRAGKAMPVDFDTVPEKDRKRALAGVPIEYDRDAGHVSHFSTCPKAAQFRKGRGA